MNKIFNKIVSSLDLLIINCLHYSQNRYLRIMQMNECRLTNIRLNVFDYKVKLIRSRR